MSNHPGSIKTLIDFATQKLESGSEARILVAHVAKMPIASALLATFDEAALQRMEREVVELIAARVGGAPLQYVIGEWDFRNITLKVDQRVLIPRPETEEVVGAALRIIDDRPACVVDLGTGSGAIALSIANEARGATVYATDVSQAALDVARDNAQRVDTNNSKVQFHQGVWFDALPEELKATVDLIVSNPPYIPENQAATLDASVVDWEPKGALFSGTDGLDDISKIVEGAVDWLKPGGTLIFEFGLNQEVQVAALCAKAGFEQIEIGYDMTNRPRWIEATTKLAQP